MIETRHWFTNEAGRLAYLDEGEGPVVVLLHGFPMTSFLWREFVPLLAGRFRVIVPDLLGSGDSKPVDGARLDLRAQTDVVAALLADLGVDRFAVVGHGVGGGVAQMLALEVSGVDAMVLLDTVAFDTWPWTDLAEASRDPVTTPGSVESTIRSAIGAGLPQGSRLPDDVLEEYLRPWRTDDGVARFARVVAGIDGRGLAERDDELGAVAFPVLILWGEDDPYAPVEAAEELNEWISTSSLGLLPGCGHFVLEDAIDTIGPMIYEYLRARYLRAPHGHGADPTGAVMIQLERRPAWVDLAEYEDEDDEHDDEGEDEE